MVNDIMLAGSELCSWLQTQQAPMKLAKVNGHPKDDNIVFLDEPHLYVLVFENDAQSPISIVNTSVTPIAASCAGKFDQDRMCHRMMMGSRWPRRPYVLECEKITTSDMGQLQGHGIICESQQEEYVASVRAECANIKETLNVRNVTSNSLN